MGRARSGLHTPPEVVRALRRRYPYSPEGRADPFQTLVATVLSQRTREEKTAEAAAALFARYPDAPSLAAAKASDVERLIRPAGFYRQKAPTIIEISRRLLKDHGGEVPRGLEELLALPGVGRKTANCVLVFAFGIPAIPVDTHVHRISNRLGWVRTRAPEQTEEALIRFLPKRYWMDINELFVLFGREICRPIGPRCSECPLFKCPSRGKLREGKRMGNAYIPGFDSTLLGGLGKALAPASDMKASSRTPQMPRTPFKASPRTPKMPRTSVRGSSGSDSFLKLRSRKKPRTSVRGG
jgi:endonuclease-3